MGEEVIKTDKEETSRRRLHAAATMSQLLSSGVTAGIKCFHVEKSGRAGLLL